MNHSNLNVLLKELRLSGFARHHDEVALRAERQGWSFGQYLLHLAQTEVDERRVRRVERFLKESRLPKDKSMATLDVGRFEPSVQKAVGRLQQGHWVHGAENLLVFGLPGVGKTHLVAALGLELIHAGFRVRFFPTFKLVQALLLAKKELRLEKLLAQLDRFDVVILDDLGYVQQERDEMEVLFTFLAERYERRSIMITSNLVFSQWEKIFKDPMTAAAAIDRLVHHSSILELNGPSFRHQAAKERSQKLQEGDDTSSPITSNREI